MWLIVLLGWLESISTPILLQVLAHFKNRNNGSDIRVFFPKGDVAKAMSILNELPFIEEEIWNSVVHVNEEALISNFSELPPLGKVYVDEELKTRLVPFSQRSASRAIHTTCGSQLVFPEGDTIRAFVWCGTWTGMMSGRIALTSTYRLRYSMRAGSLSSRFLIRIFVRLHSVWFILVILRTLQMVPLNSSIWIYQAF